jgi:hypothetical protein
MAVRRVLYQRDDGAPFIGDAISYEGKTWLVPEWLQGPTAGTRCPARIVCLDGLPQRKPSPQEAACDLVLEAPLKKDVLDGRLLSHNPLVILRPDILLREDTDFFRG